MFIKGLLSSLRQFLTIESPLKIMKNDFFFVILKTLNSLIRKLQLISKFMTSDTGQKIIIVHILTDISKSKGNKAIKFG